MSAAENIEKLIKKFCVVKKTSAAASAKMDKAVLDDAWAAYEKSKKTKSAHLQPKTWRIIMRSKISKFAAAAVVIIAVVLSVTFLDKSVAPAYAIEQTIEANRGLQFIHLKCEPAGTGVEEIWAQFDDNRELLRLRMNSPNTMDGPKDVVWQEGKAEVWFKAKKGIAVLKEKNILAQLKMSYKSFDPKLIGEQLYHAQADEKKQIEIQEPRSKDEPITITWTRNGFRTVYKVDPETKLLQQLETYELKDEKYKFLGRTRYLDYNQPIDPAMFTFDDVPADVMRVDQTTQEVGLAKGELSDEEIALEVARQCLEALINQDHAKAGKLIAGVPADWVKQQPFGKVKYLRIVSIGQPTPYPKGGLRVPCKVEVEKDGKIIVQPIALRVDEIYGQPDRRQIVDVFF